MTAGSEGLRSHVDHLAVAWDWVLRLRDDDASPDCLAEWLQWYEADPRHREAFEEMQAFWRNTGGLASDSREVAELLRGSPGGAEPAGGRARRPLLNRRTVVWAGVPVAIAASVAFVIALNLFAVPSDTAYMQQQELPDGSTVQLATKSSIKVQFTAQERRLEMQAGEAYFSVSKDPSRPFIVSVGDLQVRAVGTAFNVRRAHVRTVVTVTEGAVDIRKGADKIRATAGHQLTFDTQSGEIERAQADAAHTLAWQQGRLEYLNEPLAAVIADINRYATHRVVIEDAAVGDILFSGTVFTHGTDAWIQALPRVFTVEVEPRDDGSIVLSSRE